MLVCGCRAQSSTHSLQGILLSHYTEQASRCIMMMTTKSLPPKTNKHRAMHFCVFMSSPRAVQTLLEYSFAIILHQPSLHPLPRPPPPCLAVWLLDARFMSLKKIHGVLQLSLVLSLPPVKRHGQKLAMTEEGCDGKDEALDPLRTG